MKLNNKYNIGDVVYLKTDPEQYPSIVTGILLKPDNLIMYEISGYDDVSYRYDFELTIDKNLLLKMQ